MTTTTDGPAALRTARLEAHRNLLDAYTCASTEDGEKARRAAPALRRDYSGQVHTVATLAPSAVTEHLAAARELSLWLRVRDAVNLEVPKGVEQIARATAWIAHARRVRQEVIEDLLEAPAGSADPMTRAFTEAKRAGARRFASVVASATDRLTSLEQDLL